jgi:putative transposase
MPRPLREQTPGATYHITAHAVAGTKIVRNDRDRQRFLDELASVVQRYRWACLAVAVLDNHYHLLVRLEEPNLARGMQRLNGSYAAFFNKKYKRRGHLFGSRYYSGRIIGAGHLLMTVRYIARNRTVAACARDPGSDRWSSYAGVVGKAECWPFIARAELLGYIGPAATAASLLVDLVEGAADGIARPARVRPP